MRKIYKVVDTIGDLSYDNEGFETREGAKAIRNMLNEDHNSAAKTPNGKPRFVVARGEDHPRGATDGHDHTIKPTKWL